MSEPRLSANDIAERLSITKYTIYARIAEKAASGHKGGRLWRSQRTAVDDGCVQ